MPTTPTTVLGPEAVDALRPGVDGQPCGLRERKKKATRRALHEAALRLVAEHGLDAVTTEDIAVAADVSARTFFNYFPSKDAAVIGLAPDLPERLAGAVRARPASEDVLASTTTVVTAAVAHLEADALRPQRRAIIARDHRLASAMMGATREVEAALTDAALERASDGPEAALRARVTVAAVMSATRVAVLHHRSSDADSDGDLVEVLRSAHALLASGLAD
ncbi:MAG: TetR family transcriptional regulator [Mobilicoccus sp.]|nr:TetR family transcriptional regulator [Mobilicoccus sp.]